MLLALLSLVLPFCGCHAVLLLDAGGTCCHPPEFAMTMAARPAAAPGSPEPSAPSPDRCTSHCCSQAVEHDSAPPATDDAAAPRPTSATPRRIPGCSGDSCCVKSVPQAPPWQSPALVVVGILDDHGPLAAAAPSVRRLDWPPTLPLGQPPPPLDSGTILLV